MSDKKVVQFTGKEAQVSFCSNLCIGINECGRAHETLFAGGRENWCEPDEATTAEVKNVIERCPSGALSANIDGVAPETADNENTVTVAYDGPLFFRGDLHLEGGPEEAPGTKFRFALCRCGLSKNKPFCDNAHRGGAFKDTGAVGRTGDAEFETGGPLTVTPQKDASLLVQGNFAIKSSSGRTAWRGKRTTLCRCGASKNKPFCDGSHKAVGFKSDD